jgi:hypothetical protein
MSAASSATPVTTDTSIKTTDRVAMLENNGASHRPARSAPLPAAPPGDAPKGDHAHQVGHERLARLAPKFSRALSDVIARTPYRPTAASTSATHRTRQTCSRRVASCLLWRYEILERTPTYGRFEQRPESRSVGRRRILGRTNRTGGLTFRRND